MVNPWSETSFPTVLSNFDLKDIYNVDEYGPFYLCLPDQTYHLKNEKCFNGQHSKVHINGMGVVSCNQRGG